jgi:predicted glycoside hydrolase/deacetylase ChbG (UPF0249 family)
VNPAGRKDRAEPDSALARALGLTRGVILHVDDLGMCDSGNRAFAALHTAGLVTCGSVMAPCPLFASMAAVAAANPEMDLGVHLTLTSEWDTHRWAPLSTRSRSSGLIDQDGFFWRDLASLKQHLVLEAAEVELRAQIEHVLAAGIRPSHIDAHMAAAMLPKLLTAQIALACEYRVVPVLPRALRFAPDPEGYTNSVATLTAGGLMLPDTFRGTLPVEASQTWSAYAAMIEALPPGIMHLALHSALPGDIEAIAPTHAGWRTREAALLLAGAVRDWCKTSGIAAIGYRAIQALWFPDETAAPTDSRRKLATKPEAPSRPVERTGPSG